MQKKKPYNGCGFWSFLQGRQSKESSMDKCKKVHSDFSLMKEHPPQHVILWEEYMVYATAFGVAKEAAKALKTVMPEEVNKNQNLVVYSSFAASNFSKSLSVASASGGGSGGFSGGGGGGGGGTDAR